MDHDKANPQPAPVLRFEDTTITPLPVDGEVLFPVAQVGASLGYGEKNLTTKVRRWQKDGLLSDQHFKLVSGAVARTGRRIVDQSAVRGPHGEDHTGPTGHQSGDQSFARAPHVLCLTERGVYRVLMLSRMPKAVAFQDWLETVVLPSIRRTGSYVPEAQVGGGGEPPKLPPTPKAKALPGPASPSNAALLRQTLGELNAKRRGTLAMVMYWGSVEVIDAVEALVSIIPDSKLESNYREDPAQRAERVRAMLADAPPDVRATLDRFLGGELR